MLLGWVISFPFLGLLLRGFSEGNAFLPQVSPELWDGLLLTLVLAAGCGGRSGHLGSTKEAGISAVTCSGASPSSRVNGVAPVAASVVSNAGPPMSCCMSSGLVFTNTVSGGKFEEIHVTFIQSVGSGAPPPTTMELDKLYGWRILVRHSPCSPTSSCKADALDSNVDSFTGNAEFTGNIKMSSKLNLCLHATRNSPTSSTLQSVDLYVQDLPLTWF